MYTSDLYGSEAMYCATVALWIARFSCGFWQNY